jgi:hypothetical protein
MTKELTKADVQRINGECMEAVRKVLEANGLALNERSRTTYDGSHFSTKFEAAVINDDGTAETVEAVAFKRYAYLYGLDPADFGKSFTSRGTLYVICGLNTRAQKLPILATQVSTGKTYKFSETAVQLGLNKAAAR